MLRFPSWRFRLSTLLLAVTVTAMGLALIMTLQRERKLTAENRELSKLLGRPIVTDSARIAVGQDATFPHPQATFPGRMLAGHRFRIYRPPGRNLVLRCAFEESTGNVPQGGSRFELSDHYGDELTIDLIVSFDSGGILAATVAATSSNAGRIDGTGSRFAADEDHWIFRTAKSKMPLVELWLADIGQTPIPSKPDTPLVLLRYTSLLDFGSSPRTCVLVWLEDDSVPPP